MNISDFHKNVILALVYLFSVENLILNDFKNFKENGQFIHHVSHRTLVVSLIYC